MDVNLKQLTMDELLRVGVQLTSVSFEDCPTATGIKREIFGEMLERVDKKTKTAKAGQ